MRIYDYSYIKRWVPGLHQVIKSKLQFLKFPDLQRMFVVLVVDI
jgi:hypothetical protein